MPNRRQLTGPTILDDLSCELCESKVAVMVMDIRQGPHDRDDKGNLYEHWDPAGIHFFCSQHSRLPREIRLEDQPDNPS